MNNTCVRMKLVKNKLIRYLNFPVSDEKEKKIIIIGIIEEEIEK